MQSLACAWQYAYIKPYKQTCNTVTQVPCTTKYERRVTIFTHAPTYTIITNS